MKVKKTVGNDIILIVVLISVSLLALSLQGRNRARGLYAVVCVDGTTTGLISLDKDGTYTVNGGSNVIEVNNGFVSMSYSSCPDKLCIKQGSIMYSGQCITCLPNRVTITLKGKSGYADIIM